MNPSLIKGFKIHLQLEKGLSANTLDAYLSDVEKLSYFLEEEKGNKSFEKLNRKDLTDFILWINNIGLSARSQARIISGIRNFYDFLVDENIVKDNPVNLLDMPKIGRKLPVVLSLNEIDKMVDQIDLSAPEGQRNRAIIETLYGCGLRVSELIELKRSGFYIEKEYLKVVGKGNKERLVPMGKITAKYLQIYIDEVRNKQKIAKGNEEYIFLNRRGSKLSRVMIFYIVKDLAEMAGITKNISPHTFRHSFATHMVDAGADLRAVQEMLGHVSITTTEIYTHIDSSYLKSVIATYHPRS